MVLSNLVLTIFFHHKHKSWNQWRQSDSFGNHLTPLYQWKFCYCLFSKQKRKCLVEKICLVKLIIRNRFHQNEVSAVRLCIRPTQPTRAVFLLSAVRRAALCRFCHIACQQNYLPSGGHCRLNTMQQVFLLGKARIGQTLQFALSTM